MNILERVQQFLQCWRAIYARPKRALAEGVWWGPEPPGNDATAYGVAVEEAPVEVGSDGRSETCLYWQAVRVHHLTPEENGGRHHIFLDILDEAGQRLYGAQARVTWEGGEQVVTVDKPLNEPGSNCPMWKYQVCALQALGLPGQPLPSDRVINLHTGHPDEAPGNTLFHHSFLVVFRRTTKEALAPAGRVIQGLVAHGAGRVIMLSAEGAEVARQVIGPEGFYRFEELAAGTYVVAVEGTGIQSAPIVLDGMAPAMVDLALPVEPEVPEELEKIEEAEEKVLAEYVLFGPPAAPGTPTSLLLALDYLLARKPAFGFRPEEARAAQRVLIIGDVEAVSAEAEAALRAAGCEVERIAGDSYTVERLLAGRLG